MIRCWWGCRSVVVSCIDHLCCSGWVNAKVRLLVHGSHKGMILMESSFLLLKGYSKFRWAVRYLTNSWTSWGLPHSSPACEKWKRSIKVVPSETSRQIEGKVFDSTPFEGIRLTVSQSQRLLFCLQPKKYLNNKRFDSPEIYIWMANMNCCNFHRLKRGEGSMSRTRKGCFSWAESESRTVVLTPGCTLESPGKFQKHRCLCPTLHFLI